MLVMLVYLDANTRPQTSGGCFIFSRPALSRRRDSVNDVLPTHRTAAARGKSTLPSPPSRNIYAQSGCSKSCTRTSGLHRSRLAWPPSALVGSNIWQAAGDTTTHDRNRAWFARTLSGTALNVDLA